MQTDIGGPANAVAIQADGKIVAVGAGGSFAVARYNPDGTLDTTFGSAGTGIVTTGQVADGTFREALDIAIQPSDQKIVVSGVAIGNGFEGDEDFALARYNPDGSLDSSFGGGDGTVVTLFLATPDDLTQDQDRAEAVAIQADGDIVAVGSADPTKGGLKTDQDYAVARYNPDGSLDSDFGEDGKVTKDLRSYDHAHDLVLMPDNRILVVGSSASDPVLVQFEPDGDVDLTFNTTGIGVINFGGLSDMLAVARQPDGKIVLAGFAESAGGQAFEIIRLNADATFDTGFNENGVVTTTFNGGGETWNDVAIQPNGNIVAVGQTSGQFAVGRFLPDGQADRLFACPGAVRTNFDAGGAEALGVALDATGDIVAAGGNRGFALARYLSSGPAPDCTAPTTKIKGPKRTTNRRPTFKVSSNDPGSTFRCRLDTERKYVPCGPKYKPVDDLRYFHRYHLFVSATDQAGNIEDPPAEKTFLIERRKKK